MPIEVTSSIFDNIENAKVGDTIESEGHSGLNLLQ